MNSVTNYETCKAGIQGKQETLREIIKATAGILEDVKMKTNVLSVVFEGPTPCCGESEFVPPEEAGILEKMLELRNTATSINDALRKSLDIL